MYDKTPVYPHLDHLTWAHEPYKSIYVYQRLFTTLLLVPIWAIFYLIAPRSWRPRRSWSIVQIIVVKFMKRISRVTEVAGVTWGTRDPTLAPDDSKLKETRFAWVPPLTEEFRTGFVADDQVECQRVGTFIWPKVPPPCVRKRCGPPATHPHAGHEKVHEKHSHLHPNDPVHIVHTPAVDDDGTSTAYNTPQPPFNEPSWMANSKPPGLSEDIPEVSDAQFFTGNPSVDIEATAADAQGPPRLIGIYMHGGGYCHMSAHENSGTSRIPRRLIKDGLFQEIHAVEYRLLQHAPMPGALQDAAAVYAHLVTHHLGAARGRDGKYQYPSPPVPYHTHATMSPTLDGVLSPTAMPAAFTVTPPSPTTDHAHHAAALTAALNSKPLDEPYGGLAMPPGTTSSPESDSDHLHAPTLLRPHIPSHPDRDERGNIIPSTPLLAGNDAKRRSLSRVPSTDDVLASGGLGRRDSAKSIGDPYRPRIILIGDSAGGNLVLALARWIRDEGVLPPPDGMLLLSPSCDPSHTLPQVPASRRPRPHASTDYLLDTPEPRALMQRAFLGSHPIEMVYSPYVSPASEWVLSVFHGPEALTDLVPTERVRTGGDTRDYTDSPMPPSLSPASPSSPAATDVNGDVGITLNGAAVDVDGAIAGAQQRPHLAARTPSSNPYIRVPPGHGLFTDFPRALVVVGDAERLEREVVALERGMERDGVRVRMVWARDAVHDILMMGAWDEGVREGVWREIRTWVKEIVHE
ncbi:alpha/beta-hydrolase [Auriscalpium vulgare]|uniref:Alpha/beta-hydrolase n=1 Tax=Auriscalpium vulgare TaxID=40419 RepID=A0ACB8S7G9_9AGAM|nr:alpha/beta-hydrolase [Auriscalpium vulgare]